MQAPKTHEDTSSGSESRFMKKSGNDPHRTNERGAVTKLTSRKSHPRRILSCDTCRRVKARCEYNPKTRSCNRCQKLRLSCSLEGDDAVGITAEDSLEDERIARVEASLADMKGTISKIWSVIEGNFPSTIEHGSGSEKTQRPSTMNVNGERLEDLEFPHLAETRNDAADRSAPIMIVRKYRSANRRLYKQSWRDIIELEILSESVANKLVSEFIVRQGHIIQIHSVTDFGTEFQLRQTSPLLFAVCCLHGLRFCKDPELLHTQTHRQLYEEVRDMLGQVVLASPIPLEELYAMLIMCEFEAAPRPVFEYIEGWLLSGICAQHAVLNIDFTSILTNLNMGSADSSDRRSLCLWNNVCLVNLRFAVGTGKPPSIPADYIKQCPAILNHPEATIEDGMILAEILLFSTLYHETTNPARLSADGHCQALLTWEARWKHLLTSPKAELLRFSHDFAYLVLARRTVEDDTVDRLSFRGIAYKYALSMAQKYLQMDISLLQELPKFHHICISYCVLVLSEYDDQVSEVSISEILDVVRNTRAHYAQFSTDIPQVMNFAIEKVCAECKESATATPQQNRTVTTIQHTVGIEPSVRTGDIVEPPPFQNALQENNDPFNYGAPFETFPTIEDFFGGGFMDLKSEYEFHI